jgi:hypothetical protein
MVLRVGTGTSGKRLEWIEGPHKGGPLEMSLP